MADQADSLFTPNADPVLDEDKDYYPDIKDKYPDTKALAKKIVHADAYISRLEKENAEHRTTITAQTKLEDLVKQLNEVRQPPSNSENTNTEQRGNIDKSDVDVETVAEQLWSRKTAEAVAKANLAKVKQSLQEALGTNYSQHLQAEADRLDMSSDEMNTLAIRSPAAFLRLVGVDQGKVQSTSTAPRTQVNSEAFSSPAGYASTGGGFRPMTQGDVKTQAYYDNLRKTGKAKWDDPDILLEMHNNAIRLGDKYFDKQ